MGDWRNWLKGLIASIVGGAANSVSVVIIDPTNFNFSEGWHKLTSFALVSAIISAGLFLKQSPLPPDDSGRLSRNWKEPKE